jgi:Sulfotransferase family
VIRVMSFDPIFIIGTERSGSNLLRLILNAHSEIAVPHPPHVMSYFGPLEKYYGDLSCESNFRRLIRDVITHLRSHIHPWEVEIDEDTLVRAASPRDLFGIYAALYEQFMKATGKRYWGCKSTFMIHYVKRILASYPEAKLIWLIRDPRDVALSSQVSVFNPYHPYYTARLWAKQQELGLQLEATCRPANLLRVHYEALISNPQETVERICRFIGVPFEQTMLRFFETREARTSASLAQDWRNTAVPILSNNANKFLSRMPAEDIAIIEAVAGETMEKLNYKKVCAEV